jgi:hypothetical protein
MVASTLTSRFELIDKYLLPQSFIQTRNQRNTPFKMPVAGITGKGLMPGPLQLSQTASVCSPGKGVRPGAPGYLYKLYIRIHGTILRCPFTATQEKVGEEREGLHA